MSKITQGPWVAEIINPVQYRELTGKSGNWVIRVNNSKGVRVAEMPKTSLGIENRLANVKLIAAAPELLNELRCTDDTLRSVRQLLEICNMQDTVQYQAVLTRISVNHAAIARATGKL